MQKIDKKEIKSSLIYFIVGLILILPYIFWHSFWCLGLGLLISLYAVVHVFVCIFKGEKGETAVVATFWITLIAFSTLCLFWHETRYIGNNSHSQHIYSDCKLLEGANIKEVTEAEGFFYVHFSDCSKCQEHRYELREQRREHEDECERQELKRYLQHQIDRLDEGETADEVKATLVNDWSVNDDEEYTPGIPMKYL